MGMSVIFNPSVVSKTNLKLTTPESAGHFNSDVRVYRIINGKKLLMRIERV